MLILPVALLALGLSSTAAGFIALPASAALWLLALTAGAALGWRRPPPAGARWLPTEQRLQLPGSWMPMLLIVAIFSLRYAANVGMAINPAWRSAPALLLPLALLYGALSGVFLGRALTLFRSDARAAPRGWPCRRSLRSPLRRLPGRPPRWQPPGSACAGAPAARRCSWSSCPRPSACC